MKTQSIKQENQQWFKNTMNIKIPSDEERHQPPGLRNDPCVELESLSSALFLLYSVNPP